MLRLLAPTLGFALAACSSLGGDSSSGTTGSTFSSIFGSSSPATVQPASAPGGEEDPYCPIVDVRQGASTITIHGQGDEVATNVRYQATIGQLARECAFTPTSMTMKVGVQGRVIVGPLGQAGQMEVPLRLALVQEGPNPKTIWTKLYRVPVSVPEGSPHATFTYVEPDLTIPRPSGGDLDNFIVYVGFDQMAMNERPQRRAPPRRTQRTPARH
jgi:hypothetical protein